MGANYRSACRARSSADFISKLSIVIEEADESSYWMEMLVESEIVLQSRMNDIMKEADELVSIFTAAVITTKKKSFRNHKS